MKKNYMIKHLETGSNYKLTIDFDYINKYKINTKSKKILNDLKNDIEINFKNSYNLGTSIITEYPYLETILFRYQKL